MKFTKFFLWWLLVSPTVTVKQAMQIMAMVLLVCWVLDGIASYLIEIETSPRYGTCTLPC